MSNMISFSGEGKPEPLKNHEGDWSRRINETDRLVYRIEGGDVLIKMNHVRRRTNV